MHFTFRPLSNNVARMILARRGCLAKMTPNCRRRSSGPSSASNMPPLEFLKAAQQASEARLQAAQQASEARLQAAQLASEARLQAGLKELKADFQAGQKELKIDLQKIINLEGYKLIVSMTVIMAGILSLFDITAPWSKPMVSNKQT